MFSHWYRMFTRRTFFRTVATVIAASIWPLTGRAEDRPAMTETTERFMIPPAADPSTLVDKNPAKVDASNFDVMPVEDFGTMGLEDHEVDLSTWRFVVEGHVAEPLSLSYAELRQEPAVERKVLLICPGVFVNQGVWTGPSLARILDRVRVRSNATHVTFGGPQGPYEKVLRVPLNEVRNHRVFLAYRVNGEQLPVKHGFPLRLVAEDYYGYDWIKFVYRMTVEAI
jgi:sulfoxide reductase catalytic subunit YedY